MAETISKTAAGDAFALSGPDDRPSGAPPDAPVVALIHGLGLTRRIWDGVVPPLAARRRVLRYDLIGHGESGPPPQPLSLSAFADQLARLLDHVGAARAHLVGFSLGGMINRRFALDRPGRVASLAVLNSPHERGEAGQRLVEERARATAEGGPGATIDATLARWFTPGFRAAQPAAVAAVRADVLANDPAAYAASRWVLAHGVRELIRPDPPIAAPCLVMSCAEDSGSTPAMAEAIAAEIAGATVDIAPGLQHLGLLERPERFATPINAFLDRLEAGGAPPR